MCYRSISRTVRALMPAVLLIAVVLAPGCDASEDDSLLNPPPPDSTRVRIVNLVDAASLDVWIGGTALFNGIAPFTVSEYRGVFVRDQTILEIASIPTRRDTFPNQVLAQGSLMTYVVLPSGDSGVSVISLPVGRLDATDLATQGRAQVVVINAVDDTTLVSVRRGCQSGDTVVPSLGFGRSTSYDATMFDQSLYLFANASNIPIASAHISTPPGTIVYLIAARQGGAIRFYQLNGTSQQITGPIPEADPEARTTASVSLLNAITENTVISASIEGGSTVATGIGPLGLSDRVNVDACSAPGGDRLVVRTAAGDTTSALVRLTVGADALLVVFDHLASIRTLLLDRPSAPAGGRVMVRGVNLSTVAGSASISIGGGSPDTVAVESRPFGTLAVGMASTFREFKAGDYPFILTSATDGQLLDAGVERLIPGYYTIFVVDVAGRPELRIMQDEAAVRELRGMASPGTRITLMNVVPDAMVSFTIGQISIPPIAYSYVSRTVLPNGVTSIGSSAGNATVDPSIGSWTAVATQIGSDRRLIAFSVPIGGVSGDSASIRFLNAASTTDVVVHEDKSTASEIAGLALGTPTESLRLDERKYSFVLTAPGDTTVLARTDGVELTGGRRYLLVIAPRPSGSSGSAQYSMIWLQE